MESFRRNLFLCLCLILFRPTAVSADDFLFVSELLDPGIDATYIVAADATGDGVLDILTCSTCGISLMVGRGDLTFEPAQVVYRRPTTEIDVDDINQDSIPDILFVSTGDRAIGWMPGLGGGLFGEAIRPLNEASFSFEVADFNQDGILDVVYGDTVEANHISVAFGNGDGSFQQPEKYELTGSLNSVCVSDINLDGVADILTCDGLAEGVASEQVSVLYGNPDGTFQPAESFFVAFNPLSAATEDFNNDGIMDIVAATGASNISVLIGDAAGGFELTQYDYWTLGAARVVFAEDFTGDGIIDIAAVFEVQQAVAILEGQGDGTFEFLDDLAGGPEPYGLAVGDLNGDGLRDLVTCSNFGAVTVLPSNGNGTFDQFPGVDVGYRPFDVAIGDLNGDSINDIVTANRLSNDVSVVLGLGSGDFNPAISLPVFCEEPKAVKLADLDGDGLLDIAVACESELSILLGFGDGTFAIPQTYFALGFVIDLAIGDFNADSIPDIVVCSEGNLLGILLGNGDGTFADVEFFFVGDNPRSVTIADLNLDGNLDLITANLLSRDVYVNLGVGDGTFGPAMATLIGEKCYETVVHDFDGDGFPDVAVTSFNSGGFSILHGAGDGTFFRRTDIPTGYGLSMSLANFNNDGIMDVAVASGFGVAFSFIGNSQGGFDVSRRLYVGAFPRPITAADLNGDGLDEIITVCRLSDDVTILLNDSNDNVGSGDVNLDGVVSLLDVEPFVALLTGNLYQIEADTNCDGVLDLLDIGSFVDLLGG